LTPESLEQLAHSLRVLFLLPTIVFLTLYGVLRYRQLLYWSCTMLFLLIGFWVLSSRGSDAGVLWMATANVAFIAGYSLLLAGFEQQGLGFAAYWPWTLIGFGAVAVLSAMAGADYPQRVMVISLSIAVISALVVQAIHRSAARARRRYRLSERLLVAMMLIHSLVSLLRGISMLEIPWVDPRAFELLFFAWSSISTIGFVLLLLLYVAEQHTHVVEQGLRAELALKARQAELADVMANISHQWRDGLARIGYINARRLFEFQRDSNAIPEQWRKDEQSIGETLAFLSQTMQNFLDFYRPAQVSTRFDARESIDAVVSILDQRLSKAGVKVSVNAIAPLELQGVRNDWMQIWMNLLVNAVKAAEERGRAHAHISVTVDESGVAVCDNAGGMSEAELADANANRLPGIGIRLCHELTDRYGWRMTMTNQGEGLMVTLRPTASSQG